MSTKHPPSGPTEQEVRQHFGDKLKADAKLMRPAYTSIWALEDGTLLWDWRGGFAELDEPPKPKCVMYITGKPGSGKTALISKMFNAIEVELEMYKPRDIGTLSAITRYNSDKDTIVFTMRYLDSITVKRLNTIAEELEIQFFNINLTRN